MSHLARKYVSREVRPDELARFWSKVNKSDSCWLWTGSLARKGYGLFFLWPKSMPAHRFAFQMVNRALMPGEVVDHLCNNPSCVRPAHLEGVSQGKNIRRGHLDKKRRSFLAMI